VSKASFTFMEIIHSTGEGYEIQCRFCSKVFWICRSCYRGHQYCSEACRYSGRRESQRLSRRKHQQSPEGRADHCDRQRAYRNRLKEKGTVMEQSIGTAQTSVQALMEFKSTRQSCCICCRRSRFLEGDPYAQEYDV
jgi:hypothetical protein